MKILITAGSTQTHIDKVRVISNIFKGKTGARIAENAAREGHEVTLLTNPHGPGTEFCYRSDLVGKNVNTLKYQTFDQLHDLMKEQISTGNFDAIIHSAAVSDYKAVDVLAPRPHDYYAMGMQSVMKEKVKSNHPELYIKLVQTEKIVDKIKRDWGFKGKLVKFKLEVGISTPELIEIAKASRIHSQADIIVANLLEFFNDWQAPATMHIIDERGVYSCTRTSLGSKLIRLLRNME